MNKTTEYLVESIRNNLSALREMKELDQEGVKQTMETLKHNLETSKIRLKIIIEELQKENQKQIKKIKQQFTGVKFEKKSTV